MIKAKDGTTIKKIRQNEINDIFEIENINTGYIDYLYYPRSMDMSEKDIAIDEFFNLEFE